MADCSLQRWLHHFLSYSVCTSQCNPDTPHWQVGLSLFPESWADLSLLDQENAHEMQSNFWSEGIQGKSAPPSSLLGHIPSKPWANTEVWWPWSHHSREKTWTDNARVGRDVQGSPFFPSPWCKGSLIRPSTCESGRLQDDPNPSNSPTKPHQGPWWKPSSWAAPKFSTHRNLVNCF